MRLNKKEEEKDKKDYASLSKEEKQTLAEELGLENYSDEELYGAFVRDRISLLATGKTKLTPIGEALREDLFKRHCADPSALSRQEEITMEVLLIVSEEGFDGCAFDFNYYKDEYDLTPKDIEEYKQIFDRLFTERKIISELWDE